MTGESPESRARPGVVEVLAIRQGDDRTLLFELGELDEAEQVGNGARRRADNERLAAEWREARTENGRK